MMNLNKNHFKKIIKFLDGEKIVGIASFKN